MGSRRAHARRRRGRRDRHGLLPNDKLRPKSKTARAPRIRELPAESVALLARPRWAGVRGLMVVVVWGGGMHLMRGVRALCEMGCGCRGTCACVQA